jgi:hypothetical protein
MNANDFHPDRFERDGNTIWIKAGYYATADGKLTRFDSAEQYELYLSMKTLPQNILSGCVAYQSSQPSPKYLKTIECIAIVDDD